MAGIEAYERLRCGIVERNSLEPGLYLFIQRGWKAWSQIVVNDPPLPSTQEQEDALPLLQTPSLVQILATMVLQLQEERAHGT